MGWTTIFIYSLPQGCVNCLALCLNVMSRDQGHVDIPQNTTLIHYINDLVLIRQDESCAGGHGSVTCTPECSI